MTTWRLSWAGHSFSDADLTIGDLCAAQALTGKGWASADPLQGPNHAANLVAIVVARLEGREVFEVAAEIADRPAIELFDALGPDDEDGAGAPVPSEPGPPTTPLAASAVSQPLASSR